MDECPHCGEPLKPNARACPACGSDEKTGWASEEEVGYAAVEIPDTYDPDRWEREGREREGVEASRAAIVWVLVAIVVALAVPGLLRAC